MRDSYQKNKEMYRRRSKDWAEANPHKIHASQHQGSVKSSHLDAWRDGNITTKELGDWLLENRGKECVYCGDPAYSINHIIPLSRGGSHTWENIEMVCFTCSAAKTGKTKEEHMQWVNNLIRVFTEGDR